MNSKYLLVILWSVASFLASDNFQTLFEKGKLSHQAQEYSEAIKYYLEALEQAPVGIEQDIVRFNLATSYLENQQLDPAIDLLQKVLSNQARLPKYLYEKSCCNLILSLLQNASTLMEQEGPNFLELVSKQLQSAQSSLEEFEKAVDKSAGKYDLLSFKKALKVLQAQWALQKERSELAGFTLGSALQHLEVYISQEKDKLEALGAKELPDSLERSFLDQFFIRTKYKLPIFKKLEDAWEKTDGENKEVLFPCLYQSSSAWLKAMDYFKEGKLWPGRLQLARAKRSLTLFSDLMDHKNPILSLLENFQRVSERKLEISQPAWASSLEVEIEECVQEASSLLQQEIQACQKNLETEKTLFAQIACLLKEEVLANLKANSHPQEIYSLYMQTFSEPFESVLAIYKHLLKDLPASLSSAKWKLLAALKYTQIERSLSQDQKRLEEACSLIKKGCHEIEFNRAYSCSQYLEKYLLHLYYSEFISDQMDPLIKSYQSATQKKEGVDQLASILVNDVKKLQSLEQKASPPPEQKPAQEMVFQELEGQLEGLENYQVAQSLELKNMFLNKGLLGAQRLKRNLQKTVIPSSKQLSEAIREEEHALEVGRLYLNSHETQTTQKESFFKWVKQSQREPIKTVENFEMTYHRECAQQPESSGGANDSLLENFRLGLRAALSAQKRLESSVIAWDLVQADQCQALEYWRRALEGGENQGQKDQDGESLESSQKGMSAENSSEESENNEQGSLEASNEDLADTSGDSQGENEQEPAIYGILEQLSEMQQDDQILPQKQMPAKEGLKPW